MYTARSCLLLVTLTVRTDSKALDAVQKDSCNLGVPQNSSQSALWVSMQQRIPGIDFRSFVQVGSIINRMTWLKKRLKELGLARRGPLVQHSDLPDVQHAIEVNMHVVL